VTPISVAVVGCGHISWIHLENLCRSPSYKVAVVADVIESEARCVAEYYRIDGWTRDYRDILSRPDVEAVFVLTPPSAHAAIAIAALRAGKHVFCENPLARNLEDCKAVIAQTKNSDRVLFLAYPLRFSRDAQNVRHVISSGMLGRPVFFRTYGRSLRAQKAVPFMTRN